MLNRLMSLVTSEEGQGMTEYGLVLGAIAFGVATILVTMKTQITSLFQQFVDKLTGSGATTS